MIAKFFIRFLLFWLKIVLACIFVMVLQIEVGPKSLEKWIEQGLRESLISRYVQQTAVTGMDLLAQKFPGLKGVVKSKIVKKNSVMEIHSGLFQQMERAFDQFENENSRLPSSQDHSLQKQEHKSSLGTQ